MIFAYDLALSFAARPTTCRHGLKSRFIFVGRRSYINVLRFTIPQLACWGTRLALVTLDEFASTQMGNVNLGGRPHAITGTFGTPHHEERSNHGTRN